MKIMLKFFNLALKWNSKTKIDNHWGIWGYLGGITTDSTAGITDDSIRRRLNITLPRFGGKLFGGRMGKSWSGYRERSSVATIFVIAL